MYTDIRLSCLLINAQLKVLLDPFWLCVPRQGDFDIIFTLLRAATPSLRGDSDGSATSGSYMEDVSRIENWRGLVQAEGYKVDSDAPGEEVVGEEP